MNEGPSLIPGIWHSVRGYEGGGRGQALADERDVTLSQQGDVIRVRSLPGSPSRLEMDLTFGGRQGVMGTWMERPGPGGNHAGRVFIGTALFILAEDGRSMTGRWTGGDKDIAEVHMGTWKLTLAR